MEPKMGHGSKEVPVPLAELLIWIDEGIPRKPKKRENGK